MDKTLRKELEEALSTIEENRQHYMDLCKRKYQGMAPQIQKCRALVAKRYPNG